VRGVKCEGGIQFQHMFRILRLKVYDGRPKATFAGEAICL
jgi:hypothetical protein